MKYSLHILLIVLFTHQTHVHAMASTATLGSLKSNINALTAWAKQKKENAQRLFFCLRNSSQCDPKEVATARTWLIKASIATVAAIAAIAGLALTTKKIMDMKAEVADQDQEPDVMQQLSAKINAAYALLIGWSDKLNTIPKRLSTSLEEPLEFTSKITKDEYNSFQKMMEEIYLFADRELDADASELGARLQQACRSDEYAEQKKMVCDSEQKFALLHTTYQKIKREAAILQSYYK